MIPRRPRPLCAICADLRGAAVLRERGRLMSAVEVERRAGGAK